MSPEQVIFVEPTLTGWFLAMPTYCQILLIIWIGLSIASIGNK